MGGPAEPPGLTTPPLAATPVMSESAVARWIEALVCAGEATAPGSPTASGAAVLEEQRAWVVRLTLNMGLSETHSLRL